MLKVKSSGGRIARSTMSLVVSNLEANEFYRERLFRYLRELPVVKEWAEKIQTFETCLASFSVDTKGLGDLSMVTKELHFVMESLRPKLTEPLQLLVKQKARMAAEKCIAGEVKENGAEIAGSTSQVLQELCILWPLDTEMSRLSMELSSHMQSINLESQQRKVASLMTDLDGVLAGEDVEIESVMAGVTKISSACASIKTGSPEKKQSVEVCKAWLHLMEFTSSRFLGEKPSLDAMQAKELVEVCQLVAQAMSLGDLVETSCMLGLDYAVQLQTKIHEVCPSMDMSADRVCEQEKIVEKLKGARRLCLALKNQLDSWKEMKTESEIVKKLKVMFETQCTSSTSMVGHWSGCKEASYLAELQAAVQALGAVSGGRKDGRAWTSVIDKKCTWKSLTRQWENGELMDVEPTDLETGISECQQVMQSVKHHVQARSFQLNHQKKQKKKKQRGSEVEGGSELGCPKALFKLRDCVSIELRAVEKEVVQSVNAVVQKASTTKAEGCLIYNLMHEKEKLRESVQSEMKAFRLVVGKEAERDLLLPLLWEKVQHVLKGGSS